MIEIVRQDPPKPGVKYFRYEEPASIAPPPNSRLYSYEYRTFLICRKDIEFHFWTITMADETDPPVALQGNYTTKERAQRAIDDFLELEFTKQKQYEVRN
ncbi:hypothetical protein [Bradyrhizobium quebecense]|uniref:DUF1508 domain-containing protein n=2 Tax=Bradyrhizobium quebecense TaxID=2748629 RepID=A0ABS3MEC2_9BRAD|nr:hypothetical protein [Bradyrhizobium quebecense]UGY05085.1 hypothetical protein J4P68_0010260 [Bradyrhizobium quebecense]